MQEEEAAEAVPGVTATTTPAQAATEAILACEAVQLEALVRYLVDEHPSLSAALANMLGYEMGERQRKAQAGPRLVGR